MPVPIRLAQLGRIARLLRLAAAVAVILALVAIVTIARGGSADRSEALIAAAVMLGAGALIGTALVAWPYRRKDKHDPRP